MPPEYIQQECFTRTINMSEKSRIPRGEILEAKVWRPYASKTTYHFKDGTYETEGHCMYQPLNQAGLTSYT